MKRIYLNIPLIIIYLFFMNAIISSEESDSYKEHYVESYWNAKYLNNNRRIKQDFSWSESLLYQGLIWAPLVYKYYKNWRLDEADPRKLHLEPSGILNNLKAEFKNIKALPNIVKAIWNNDNRFANIKKLFNNTIFRIGLLYLFAPRVFHGIEKGHKWTINNLNEERAKKLFQYKIEKIKKQEEIKNIITTNSQILSSLFDQLLNKNSNIKSADRIKDQTKLYIDLIKLKKILETKKDFLDKPKNQQIITNALQNELKNINIDPSLQDINFIIQNAQDILKLTSPQLIKKLNYKLNPEDDIMYQEKHAYISIENTLKEIKSLDYDKEYILKNNDLNSEDSWQHYKKAYQEILYPNYPYMYSKYTNDTFNNKPWFNETNYTTPLIP